MDSQILPSLSEFNALVNTFNFSQQDIELQSKTATEVGYSSFENYLEFVYFRLTKQFDLESIVQEIGEEFQRTQTIKYNLPFLLKKHRDDSIEEELAPIYARVQKLPSEIKDRIGNFENKLNRLFFVSVIDKNKHDVLKINFLKASLIDASKQVSFIDPETTIEYQKLIDLIDGMTLSNSNQEIENQISLNYYFTDKTKHLEQLHKELVHLDYISQNEDLKKTFESKNKKSSEERMLWLTDLPKLLYLLYRLNNKKQFVDGNRIDVIAGNLFKFKTEKTSANIRTNYNKVINNFNEESYLSKKMSDLKNVLDNLIK